MNANEAQLQSIKAQQEFNEALSDAVTQQSIRIDALAKVSEATIQSSEAQNNLIDALRDHYDKQIRSLTERLLRIEKMNCTDAEHR